VMGIHLPPRPTPGSYTFNDDERTRDPWRLLKVIGAGVLIFVAFFVCLVVVMAHERNRKYKASLSDNSTKPCECICSQAGKD